MRAKTHCRSGQQAEARRGSSAAAGVGVKRTALNVVLRQTQRGLNGLFLFEIVIFVIPVNELLC